MQGLADSIGAGGDAGDGAGGTADGRHPATGTDLRDLLEPWLPSQRWYPAKGRPARVQLLGRLLLPSPGTRAPEGGASLLDAPGGSGADAVHVLVHLARLVTDAGTVTDAGDGGSDEHGEDDGAPGDVVQVPLVHRRTPRSDPGAGAALVGVLTEASGTDWHVYDGPRDPAFTAALLDLLGGRVRAVGLDAHGRRAEAGGSAAGDRRPGAHVPAPGSPARVLSGEQSNTSIIVEPDDGGAPVIVKVFRVLHAGRNPDVEVQAALSGAGVRAVPALVAWAEGAWPTRPVDPGGSRASGGSGGDLARGDLAVASEFLAGAQDAWREATAAVAAGTDFAERARTLGAATAAVHRAMAQELPSRAATAEDANALVDGLRRRTEWALASAPALAEHAEALRGAVAGLDVGDLPVLQRVHGDYHLGQVLDVPGRGWVLLDFEGEPLRPLAERTLPDLALRDVAGMLRSFDYAASQATTGQGHGAEARAARTAAAAWAVSAREAFTAGYAEAGGEDPRARRPLLDALELDKALYEVVYETRNRPDWLPVPLSAVSRLLDSRPDG